MTPPPLGPRLPPPAAGAAPSGRTSLRKVGPRGPPGPLQRLRDSAGNIPPPSDFQLCLWGALLSPCPGLPHLLRELLSAPPRSCPGMQIPHFCIRSTWGVLDAGGVRAAGGCLDACRDARTQARARLRAVPQLRVLANARASRPGVSATHGAPARGDSACILGSHSEAPGFQELCERQEKRIWDLGRLS